MRAGRPPKQVDPDSGPLAAFAHRLRAQRLALGLSIETVAHRAGCSTSILGEYERAERAPRDEQLVRDLAAVLDLPPDQLVSVWRAAIPVRASVAPRTGEPTTRTVPRSRVRRRVVVVGAVAVMIAAVALKIELDDPAPIAGASSSSTANERVYGSMVVADDLKVRVRGVGACAVETRTDAPPEAETCPGWRVADVSADDRYELRLPNGHWWLIPFARLDDGTFVSASTGPTAMSGGTRRCNFELGQSYVRTSC